MSHSHDTDNLDLATTTKFHLYGQEGLHTGEQCRWRLHSHLSAKYDFMRRFEQAHKLHAHHCDYGWTPNMSFTSRFEVPLKLLIQRETPSRKRAKTTYGYNHLRQNWKKDVPGNFCTCGHCCRFVIEAYKWIIKRMILYCSIINSL